MKIAFVSDLHVENYKKINWGDYPADYLLIAGDTTNNPHISKFFSYEQPHIHYKRVFFTDGNHEHYHNLKSGSNITNNGELAEINLPDNVTYLNGSMADIGEYTIFGCNGWYTFESSVLSYGHSKTLWPNKMNDYDKINFLDEPFTPEKLAEIDASKLRAALQNSNAKFIVMTHTAPSEKCLTMKGDWSWDSNSGYFFNKYMEEIMIDYKDRIVVWHHGHTHEPYMKNINGVLTVCNPRGYRGENPNWEPLELDI